MTTLLAQARNGSAEAEAQLIELVYPHLRAIAANLLRGESGSSVLQTTALVHEAWLRLFPQKQIAAENRVWFFYAVSRAMRQTLVDCARARLSLKRGGAQRQFSLDEVAEPASDEAILQRTLAVDLAVDRLAGEDTRAAKVVELHFFCDMTFAEIGEVLGMSEASARDDWRFAKAWLRNHLELSTK